MKLSDWATEIVYFQKEKEEEEEKKTFFTSSVINKFTQKSRKNFLSWEKPGEFCHGAAARAVKIQETDLKSKRSTRNVLSKNAHSKSVQ